MGGHGATDVHVPVIILAFATIIFIISAQRPAVS